MTPDPLPLLGAEPGAPKILGQVKKSPTSSVRGSKFLPPKIVNRLAHKCLGSHFRLANGVLPPCPKNQFHLWDVFLEFWNYDSDKIQNLHSSGTLLCEISFWEKSQFTILRNGVLKFFGWDTFGVYPLRGSGPQILFSIIIAPVALRQTIFVGGNRPIFGGVMGVWKVRFWRTLAYFFRKSVHRFSIFLLRSTDTRVLTILKI